MKNLLLADFSRLIKNKFVWLSYLAVVVLSFFEAYIIFTENIDFKIKMNYSYYGFTCCNEYGQVFTLERIFSTDAQFIVFLILATFVSLYIGAEFFSGGIKNKAVAGHGKLQVYISYLIVSSVYALLLSVFFISSAIVAVTVLESKNNYGNLPIKFILKASPYYICAVIAIACILVLICLALKDRKKAVLACILVVFILFAINLVGVYFLTGHEFTWDYEAKEVIQNPYYPSDTTLTVCSFITRLNPVCQTRGYLHYMWAQIEHTCYDPLYTHKDLENYMPDIAFYPLYSLAWVAISALGCAVLSKRDNL